jgi:hypothetical protein
VRRRPEICCEYADVVHEMMSLTPENFDLDMRIPIRIRLMFKVDLGIC